MLLVFLLLRHIAVSAVKQPHCLDSWRGRRRHRVIRNTCASPSVSDKNYLLTLSYTSHGRLLISVSPKWIGHILKMRSLSHICQANRTIRGVTTVWRQDAHQANADVWTSFRVAILKRNFPYMQVQFAEFSGIKLLFE